jgi:L-ascorbate metabolism protein UlaG (beta-lactamase superfamily)
LPVELTWWGHSTASLTDQRTHLLTDPVLTDRVAHLTRRRGASPSRLSPDAVLVSHLHHDHLHLPSLRRLPARTRVVLPVGGAGLLDALGLDPVEVEPGDTVTVGGLSVRAVRAMHDGRRHPGSSWTGPALGFVVEGTARTWFVGDSGPAPTLGADVGSPDVVLVPVGGWGPVSRAAVRDQHLGPPEAAALVARVGASRAVPIHYGTLWPSGLRAKQSFLSPGERFAALCPQARVLAPGESTSWPGPPQIVVSKG